MRTYPIAQGTLFYIPWQYEWKGNPKRRGYMCVHMADSVFCTVETNTREGNGTPLQYSCLENPMDRGAWWAAVYGVSQSRTRLKWLSSSSGSDTTERLHFHFLLSCIGEGNGSPLQCSCLENPRDGGAWWAAVYGVTQSRTRLKWLSSSSSRN